MDPNPRQLAAVLHALLARGPFESLADAADALKWAAVGERLPYDGGAVSEAIGIVGRSRQVVRPLVRSSRRPGLELEAAGGDPIGRAAAAAVLERVAAGVLERRRG